ncbi:Cell cycle-associated protein, partial [Globisporangium polare]
MVRKKRKGVVKDAPTGGGGDASNGSSSSSTTAAGASNSSNGSQPARVALQLVVSHVPVDAPLAIALTIAEVPVKPEGKAPTHQVETLQEWYALLCDASSLYDQLKVLQLFRSKCSKALLVKNDDETVVVDTSAFVVATWKLMFRLYVSSEAEALRKNFFLILDVLAQSDAMPTAGSALESPLQQAAGDELHLFLDQVWTENDKPSSPDQSVHALDLLLLVAEFPFLARVLVNDSATQDADGDAKSTYLLRFVKFCADQLAFLASPIVDYSVSPQLTTPGSNQSAVPVVAIDATASTNVVLLSSERCGHALKNEILLCTMKDFLYARLRKIESSEGGGVTFDQATADFLRILGHCVLILQTPVVHKDLLTQAGLAYCLVLRLLLQAPVSGKDDKARITTRLLLQAMYPEKSIVSTTASAVSSPILRIHIDADMDSFESFSRLAVYRGMLNSLSDDELVLPFAQSEEKRAAEEKSVLDLIFSTAQDFCQEESLSTRLYAFQVLEAFLRRAVAITQRQQQIKTPTSATLVPISPSTLLALTSLILLNWEHPSKKVNQFMAQMFVHVVNYLSLSSEFDSWKHGIVTKLVEFPQHSRAKYGALTILLSEYSARLLLKEHPTLLESVLLAVGHKDVSAAAAGLFAQILDELDVVDSAKKSKKKKDLATTSNNGDEKREWRLLWIDNVVQVLLSKDANLRSRVAMYVMPLLLKKDPGCVPLLVEKLRSASNKSRESDTCLWAIIEIMKFARKKVSPEKLLGLSSVEIEEGLSHAKAETRSSAFDAICASLKSTNMPTRHELKLIQKYLVIHGKEISSSSRMNAMIGLKNILFRVKESLRINSKQPVSANVPADVLNKQREDLELAQSFKNWIELFIVTSIYSGAIPQRQITGLDVMLMYLQVFGFDAGDNNISSVLLSSHMVTSLLNMLVSSWDVIRSLAYSILDLYPDELPGFTSKESLTLLLKWSMALCVSARQRESDAGGLFMRLLFKKSAAIFKFGIEFQSEPNQQQQQQEIASVTTPQISFVMKLTGLILSRLGDATASDKARRGELPLVHGLLLSLRYIVESVNFTDVAAGSSVEMSEWRVAMEKVFLCIRKAMHFSLFVVGDATSGVGDEELSEAYTSGVVVGEVNSLPKTDAIPLRVDCRGHLILEDGEVGGDDENDTEQRAVVGSWLAARECGAILDVLMRRVPLPRVDDSGFFTTEMAKRGGEILLNSLFELKHKGAVATAYQAFEGVCRSFLANGETNPVIGGLPQVWADRLLDRLERSEQHFILRRSSGFAFSFVAILRSEPRNSAAVILPKVMANLLRLASLDTDAIAADSQQQQHLLWRSRVHALNILKLICQDAILADDVAVYVAQMLEIAVFGFDCSSWAVRNSSMMLFAAATQRAIGDKRIADGASKVKVSSVDVFSRFQQLNGFIFRELEKCTSSFESGAASTTPPPGLYPILMFMSRLKPGDEDAGSQKPLSDFIPLVIKCASQPTMAIRQMAAKVLATIVSDEDAVELLNTLTSQLPNGVRTPSSAPVVTKKSPPMTSNSVHGVLTQIHYLVSKYLDVENAATVESDERRAEVVRQILHQLASTLLPTKMWLWTNEKPLACGSIRAVFLEIVDTFVKFCCAKGAPVLTDDVEHVLGQIQHQSAKDLQDRCASTAPSSNDKQQLAGAAPGEYVADRALVSIFFGVWKFRKIQWLLRTENAPGGVLPLVDHMLQSPVLEIRKKATKQLANVLQGDAHFTLKLSDKAYESLRVVLAQQLLVETHPKVKSRQLQLLVHCQSELDSALPKEIGESTQKQLLEILEQSADADVLGPSLELLALIVRHDKYASDAICQTLKQEIVTRSSEQQTLVLRQAAARALRHSGFLTLVS